MFKAKLLLAWFVVVLVSVGAYYWFVSTRQSAAQTLVAETMAEATLTRAMVDLDFRSRTFETQTRRVAESLARSGLLPVAPENGKNGAARPDFVAALKNVQPSLSADLFWLLDAKGKVLARLDDPGKNGDNVRGLPAVASVLEGRHWTGPAVVAGRLMVLTGEPMFDAKSDAVTGGVLTGWVLDERWLKSLPGRGAGLALVSRDVVLASAGGQDARSLEDSLKTLPLVRGWGEKIRDKLVFGSGKTSFFAVEALFPGDLARLRTGLVAYIPVPPKWIALGSAEGRFLLIVALVAFVLGGLIAVLASSIIHRQAVRLAAQIEMTAGRQSSQPTKLDEKDYIAELKPLFTLLTQAAKNRQIDAALTATPPVINLGLYGEVARDERRTPTALPEVPPAPAQPVARPAPKPTAPAMPAPAARGSVSRTIEAEQTPPPSLEASDLAATVFEGGGAAKPKPVLRRAAAAAATGAPRPTQAEAAPAKPVESAPRQPTRPMAPGPKITPAAPLAAAGAERPLPENEPEYYQQVFAEYLNLRDRLGQPTHTVNKEKFLANLKANADRIKTAKGCRQVRYTVFEKDGQAQVKATPV